MPKNMATQTAMDGLGLLIQVRQQNDGTNAERQQAFWRGLSHLDATLLEQGVNNIWDALRGDAPVEQPGPITYTFGESVSPEDAQLAHSAVQAYRDRQQGGAQVPLPMPTITPREAHELSVGLTEGVKHTVLALIARKAHAHEKFMPIGGHPEFLEAIQDWLVQQNWHTSLEESEGVPMLKVLW